MSRLYQGRVFLAFIALCLTGFFLFHAQKIEFDLSPETIFIEDDPSYTFYQNTYLPQFAHLGVPGVLAIENKDGASLVFAIKKAKEVLSANKYIKQVISPHDQQIFMPTKDGPMLIPTIKDGELSAEAIQYFSTHPLYKGVFLGKDKHSLALVFTLDVEFQNHQKQEVAVKSINQDLETLKKALPDYNLYLTGLPFIQNEIVSLLKSDQLKLVPFLVLFLIILLLAMTKHPLGTLYPLLIIFVATIWTIGFMSLIGHKVNVVNNSIIILILVIGIADSVHIYTRYVEESIGFRKLLKPGEIIEKSAIVKTTLSAMVLPCFLTSATTALGFFASSAAGVEIIQEFGYDTAVGIIFCFCATFMLMPLLLSLHPVPKSHSIHWLSFWPKKLSIDAMLQSIVGKSLRYAKVLTGLTLILIALSVVASQNISSKQTWIGELPDDNQAIISLSFVEKNYGGVMPFYVVFSGDHQKLASYETSLAINNLAEKLRDHPLKPTVRSPVDAINFVLKSNPVPLDLAHIDEETFRELSIMTKSEENPVFWSKNGKYLRIEGFLPNVSTDESENYRKFLLKELKDFQVAGVSATITGSAVISSQALHNITRDMKKSILLASIYITVFIAIFFRSIRYALIAMMPNLLPIGLTIGIMSLLDIDVRLATVMIFSMALGLSIDTCIHLLCRVQEEIKKAQAKYQKLALIRSIHRAFRGSGRPIIYTTAILLGGFSIMMFSKFLAMHDFAVISAIVILSALFADIILLPALIWVTRPKRNFWSKS